MSADLAATLIVILCGLLGLAFAFVYAKSITSIDLESPHGNDSLLRNQYGVQEEGMAAGPEVTLSSPNHISLPCGWV